MHEGCRQSCYARWAVLSVIPKSVQERLISAEVARTQALAGRDAAMDARTLSEEAATGALAASHVADEKLLVSRLRLEGIVQSAMDSIITVDGQRKIVLFNHAAE